MERRLVKEELERVIDSVSVSVSVSVGDGDVLSKQMYTAEKSDE
jgi:hypothetical protein